MGVCLPWWAEASVTKRSGERERDESCAVVASSATWSNIEHWLTRSGTRYASASAEKPNDCCVGVVHPVGVCAGGLPRTLVSLALGLVGRKAAGSSLSGRRLQLWPVGIWSSSGWRSLSISWEHHGPQRQRDTTPFCRISVRRCYSTADFCFLTFDCGE